MVDAVRVLPGAANQIRAAGSPVTAVFGGVQGGIITNPSTAADQGIAEIEVLYYSFVGAADPFESGTTFALQPGQALYLPKGLARDVSVNAVTDGHRFSCIIWQPPPQPTPTPVPGNFPPTGPTTLLKTIPAYVYEQYQDDEDIQAFFRAYNEVMQEYIDWFALTQLPVYTGQTISGSLLDWIAGGIYGSKRPALSSGRSRARGPYNTTPYNTVPYGVSRRVGPDNVTVTTDDIFKRILTWSLYRGDGKQFNLRWLKRRCMRFLFGDNGTDPVLLNLYQVSAAFASKTQINIQLPNVPNATILKEAIDSSAVILPFQYSYSVTVAA